MKYAVLLLTLLAGCATPYQHNGLLGGFSETWYQENKVAIFFKGNIYTDEQRALDFALLRAAELGKEKGFKHFMVLDSSFRMDRYTYSTQGTAESKIMTGPASNYGGNAASSIITTYTPPETANRYKPRQTLIVLYTDSHLGGDALPLFNNAFLIESISNKYKIEL